MLRENRYSEVDRVAVESDNSTTFDSVLKSVLFVAVLVDAETVLSTLPLLVLLKPCSRPVELDLSKFPQITAKFQ